MELIAGIETVGEDNGGSLRDESRAVRADAHQVLVHTQMVRQAEVTVAAEHVELVVAAAAEIGLEQLVAAQQTRGGAGRQKRGPPAIPGKETNSTSGRPVTSMNGRARIGSPAEPAAKLVPWLDSRKKSPSTPTVWQSLSQLPSVNRPPE